MHAPKQARNPTRATEMSRHTAPGPEPQQVTPELNLARALGNQAYGKFLQAKQRGGGNTPSMTKADRDGAVQRQPEEPIKEEEEELQMKADPAVLQLQEIEEDEEEPLQGKFTTSETPAQLQGDVGEAANRTGMPGRLKAGLETLSGMDLSGIRVHTNSSKPAQLNALAYTQGQDIHVGPGQEKHLPHEGWHAVQQMQGRVKPTIQAKGVSINDDAGLEREADVMGAKALQMKGAEEAMTASGHQGSLGREVETMAKSDLGGEAIGELTHVVQQRGMAQPPVQAKYKLDEMKKRVPSGNVGVKLSTGPDAWFFPGSAINTKNRKAFVLSGLHGTEKTAELLGREVEAELSSGRKRPDLHTVLIPDANPSKLRGAGKKGSTWVPDLNREFGGTKPSPNPIAREITQVVNEFQPERILSVHAIGKPKLSGLFLDPVRPTGTDPKVPKTRAAKEKAFTGDAANLAHMQMTEEMIEAVRKGSKRGKRSSTSGNDPGLKKKVDFPRSMYPSPVGTRTHSQFNLLYPQQSQVKKGKDARTSLGVWASQLTSKPGVITLEIGGYAERKAGENWRAFLPAVWAFLKLSGKGSVMKIGANAGGPQFTHRDVRKVAHLKFMREVYRRQVEIWKAKGSSYVHKLERSDLSTLPGAISLPVPSIMAEKDAAKSAIALVNAANAAIKSTRPKDKGPKGRVRKVTKVVVRSGYRSAQEQMNIWTREAQRYYKRTAKDRSKLPGGSHGAKAAQFLAEYTNKRIHSPGFSAHQRGLAIDFSYSLDSSIWAQSETGAPWFGLWKGSWLFKWLKTNALKFNFVEDKTIDEPWHWVFEPGALTRAIDQLLKDLDDFWDIPELLDGEFSQPASETPERDQLKRPPEPGK